MSTLDGKVAWITGGGGGIGEAAAKALAASGAHVVVSGRRREELDRVASEIAAAGGSAEAAALDVVDAEAAQAIADDLAARRGGVDRGAEAGAAPDHRGGSVRDDGGQLRRA